MRRESATAPSSKPQSCELYYHLKTKKGRGFDPLPLIVSLIFASRRRRVAARYRRQDGLERVGRGLLELRASALVLGLRRLVVVEREARDDAAYLDGVESLAFEERLGEANHHVAVIFEDVSSTLVLLADDLL